VLEEVGLKHVAPSAGEERAEADREKAGNLEPKKANMHPSTVESHLPATAPKAWRLPVAFTS
jgi:hypothetical protein